MAKEKNKSILVVSQHFWPENFRLNDICDFLLEKDCTIEVLCGIPNYPEGIFFNGYSYTKNRKQSHDGIVIHRAFEIPRGKNTNLRIFLNYISFPIASLFHIPRLLTKSYDKIFIYQLSPVFMAIAGIIIGKIKKTETTMYVLDLWPENLFSVLAVKNSFFRKLATSTSHWHYRHVDKLIVLSEHMKTKLINITQIDPHKIIVLPQASEKVYEKTIKDLSLSKKFDKDKFNILFTGNISPAQSFETVIDAARRFQRDGITDIRWIVVGDGMSRRWLENRIKESKLDSYFFFEGQKSVEEIPKYTTIADLLIGCLVKSDLLEATIPAKVMSYIASGKPMVLAMDGEVQTLINNTIQCGLVGPAGDSDAFYANIKKMYQSTSKKRATMGERANKYHIKHFERNLILTKMYNFIFNLSKV